MCVCVCVCVCVRLCENEHQAQAQVAQTTIGPHDLLNLGCYLLSSNVQLLDSIRKYSILVVYHGAPVP